MSHLNETLLYIKGLLIAVFSPSTTKVVFAVLYLAYSFLFDVSKSSAYLSLLVLIFLDFVTSLWAAKICGDPIRSSKIGNSGIKVFVYFAVICGAFLTEKGLISQISVLDETVLAWFMAREFVSLLENAGRMGYDTPKKLLNQQIKDFFDKKI